MSRHLVHIALGADHRGYLLKEFLKQHNNVGNHVILWVDVGAHSQQQCDYPVIAQKLCSEILNGAASHGILLCATGVGMSIAANRIPGIYAAVAWNADIARLAKEDDNANVLVLPAEYVDTAHVVDIVGQWLSASFKNGKYQQRLTMLEKIKEPLL